MFEFSTFKKNAHSFKLSTDFFFKLKMCLTFKSLKSLNVYYFQNKNWNCHTHNILLENKLNFELPMICI